MTAETVKFMRSSRELASESDDAPRSTLKKLPPDTALLMSRVHWLKSRLVESQSREKRLKEQKEFFDHQLSDSQQRWASAIELLFSAVSRCRTLESENVSLRGQINQLEEERDVLLGENSSLQSRLAQFNRFSGRLSSLAARFSAFRDENRRLQTEVGDLSSELDSRRRQVGELSDQLQSLRASGPDPANVQLVATLRQKVAALESERDMAPLVVEVEAMLADLRGRSEYSGRFRASLRRLEVVLGRFQSGAKVGQNRADEEKSSFECAALDNEKFRGHIELASPGG
jgi:chromosome segregation ATPase